MSGSRKREGERATYGRAAGGSEDQGTEVGGALVAERASGVDQGSDSVGLQGSSDEGGAIGNGGTAGLLGAHELLGAVGRLGALVSLAEQRCQHDQLSRVSEDSAEGNSRGLDGGKVCIVPMAVSIEFMGQITGQAVWRWVG